MSPTSPTGPRRRASSAASTGAAYLANVGVGMLYVRLTRDDGGMNVQEGEVRGDDDEEDEEEEESEEEGGDDDDVPANVPAPPAPKRQGGC